MQQFLRYWLALLHLRGVGARTVFQWLNCVNDVAQLFMQSQDDLLAAGLPLKQVALLQQANWQRVDADIAWMQSAKDNHIICFDDANYPPLLKEIADPPLVLYVRGNPEILTQRQFAIVGSRHATQTGLHNASYFAKCLAEAGFIITSGLALGIDGACHRGALDAEKGLTIGVAGTGLMHCYPRTNRQLCETIIQQGGAIISEFPLDSPPLAQHFPKRNRIIAGLSCGVLVVEAALRSGSLVTAHLAAEQGKEIFAIPGSIHQPLSRGCHHLLREGAVLVETIEDILQEFSLHYQVPVQQTSVAKTGMNAEIPADCAALLQQIEYEMTPYDVILCRSGLTAGKVSSMLLTLELNGYIHAVAGGYIRAVLNQ